MAAGPPLRGTKAARIPFPPEEEGDRAPRELLVGDLVEVHGQQGAEELNGRRGRIVALVEETSRYEVRLDGESEPTSVRAANLRALEAPGRPPGGGGPEECGSMPAAFMETTPGTPVFRVLLRLLPAESLLALACCQAGLRSELQGADEAWEQAVQSTFGGSVAAAQRRCPEAASPRAAFSALTVLRRRMGAVEVVRGDLRDAASMGVEAVVCPANASLEPYGPAARAVFGQAGRELTRHLAGFPRPLEVGTACWTPGFGLGTRGLVHAVGPDRNTVDGDRKLHQAYAAAVAKVVEHGHQSVAFGSISTGGNGFKVGLAARVAVEEMREALARLGTASSLRIVFVAFEEEAEETFRSALFQIRRRVNEDLLEVLPVIILDSMLPRQRLSFGMDDVPLPVAVRAACDRFAMLGIARGQHAIPIPFGVEVRVRSRTSVGGSTRLEVVGGRTFAIPGLLQHEGPVSDGHGRHYLQASVAWTVEEGEASLRADLDWLLTTSKALGPLAAEWLGLVRADRERRPGQMDAVLEDLGPMPPPTEFTDRALWVCALINPLPALGVAHEVRPRVLMAGTARKRLEVATEGIRASIAHLRGPRAAR